MPEQSEGNNHTSKINFVFPSCTIYYSDQKNTLSLKKYAIDCNARFLNWNL